MEFQKVLETRRTVRKYSAGVTREQMEELLRAAQEAPSWKNSQTGRYYCVLSEEMVDKIRMECLPDAGNAGKSEHAALIITTFVHDRAGFQKDGSADNELGNGWGCYDLGLQNENLILKATDLGLSTLIMGLREADRLREILNIRYRSRQSSRRPNPPTSKRTQRNRKILLNNIINSLYVTKFMQGVFVYKQEHRFIY